MSLFPFLVLPTDFLAMVKVKPVSKTWTLDPCRFKAHGKKLKIMQIGRIKVINPLQQTAFRSHMMSKSLPLSLLISIWMQHFYKSRKIISSDEIKLLASMQNATCAVWKLTTYIWPVKHCENSITPLHSLFSAATEKLVQARGKMDWAKDEAILL